uniref:LysR family transcriptional regulator n=1 Tax=Aminobacter niigataensis TaxID=83265 RepID=UPI0028525AFC|nr:LysR family transcriptional regulator [Aminobacter niigataensis]WMD00092.1 LysR family transcriptional regulator [Aminobacter niigataensis]
MSKNVGFTLKQLTYFTTVAEYQSVTEAAKRLAVSQSAISAAITDLETLLSTRLLIRTRAKGVCLTKAAEAFFVKSKHLLDAATELQEEGIGLGRNVNGEIVVGCYSILSPFFIPHMLMAMKSAFPELTVRVLEAPLDQVQQALLSGLCEIAFVFDLGAVTGISMEIMREYPPYALFAAEARWKKRKAISLAELESEPFVMIDLPFSRTYYDSLANQCGVTLNVGYRTTNFETARGLVSYGLGYGIMTQRLSLAPVDDGKKLLRMPFVEELPAIKLSLATVSQARLSRRAEAVRSVARTIFSQE